MTGEVSVLKALDFEALAASEPTYTFTIEAVDVKGTMPPGLASVTVRILVSVCVWFLCPSKSTKSKSLKDWEIVVKNIRIYKAL